MGSPSSRPVQTPEQGTVVALPQAGGPHHRYERRAAQPTHRMPFARFALLVCSRMRTDLSIPAIWSQIRKTTVNSPEPTGSFGTRSTRDPAQHVTEPGWMDFRERQVANETAEHLSYRTREVVVLRSQHLREPAGFRGVGSEQEP